MSELLNVKDLKIYLKRTEDLFEPVKSVDFSLSTGQTLALLGESGSGKSLTALSILQLLPPNALYGKKSKIMFEGVDLLELSDYEMQKIRGGKIAMIFQEPMTSLNPVMTVGEQISEAARLHQGLKGSKLKAETLKLLSEVQIKDPKRCFRAFPHQLSGGMRQRAMIAMALAGRPKLLIADEPTTALDVTTQAQIVELLQQLQQDFKMSILFITHNIKLANQLADHIAVMQAGRIIEQGEPRQLLTEPKHPYTKQLVEARPRETKAALPEDAEEILMLNNLSVFFPIKGGILGGTTSVVTACEDISFKLRLGETLSLVGESGSGKTTLAKVVACLIEPSRGEIILMGDNLRTLSKDKLRKKRALFQIIFQDPFSAMDPRLHIRDILLEGMLALNVGQSRKEREDRIDHLLVEVGLDPSYKTRYPHQLSGGQRQRICIARALAVGPELLILDEPTSSLDASVQAQILDLLIRLQKELSLSYLFITHNISIVQALSHTIAVMTEGRIVEFGATETVLSNPQHPYTQSLLAASDIE